MILAKSNQVIGTRTTSCVVVNGRNVLLVPYADEEGPAGGHVRVRNFGPLLQRVMTHAPEKVELEFHSVRVGGRFACVGVIVGEITPEISLVSPDGIPFSGPCVVFYDGEEQVDADLWRWIYAASSAAVELQQSEWAAGKAVR